MTAPYDRPTVSELLEAVRYFLSTTLADEVSDRMAFHCRVAANMIAIVERELTSVDEHTAAHRARLDRLGVADDSELAAQIASGAADNRHDNISAALREGVWDKLMVANPKYVGDFTDPQTASEERFRRSD